MMFAPTWAAPVVMLPPSVFAVAVLLPVVADSAIWLLMVPFWVMFVVLVELLAAVAKLFEPSPVAAFIACRVSLDTTEPPGNVSCEPGRAISPVHWFQKLTMAKYQVSPTTFRLAKFSMLFWRSARPVETLPPTVLSLAVLPPVMADSWSALVTLLLLVTLRVF